MRVEVKKHKITTGIALTFFVLLLAHVPVCAQVMIPNPNAWPDVTVHSVEYGYRLEVPVYNRNNIAQWSGCQFDVVTGQNQPFLPTGASATIRFIYVGDCQVMCCIQGGTCVSISVRVHPMAPSVSISPSVLCETGSVTIMPSHPFSIAGTNEYRVYNSETGGSLIAAGSGNISISSVSTSTTYWVSTYNSIGGESLTRTPVSVSVTTNTVATPGVSPAYGIVGGQAAVYASGAYGGAYYRWGSSDGGTRTTTDGYTTYPVPPASVSNFVSVQLDNGVCQGPKAWIPITVYAKPMITATGLTMGEPATLVCNPDYELYKWYRDGVAVTAALSQNTYVTDIPGVYQVEVFKNGASGKSNLFTLGAQFQGLDENYIVTDNIQIKSVTNESAVGGLTRRSKTQAVQYFDGLGRPMQTVATQGSPSGYDVVQPTVYDPYGREARKYLPVVLNRNDGRYKPGIIDNAGNYMGMAAVNPYNNGTADKIDDSPQPYAEAIFESSPLDRVLKQGAPGTPWQPAASGSYDGPLPSDRSIKKAYASNGPTDVPLLTYNETTKRIGLGNTNYYAATKLQANKTKDEHNHAVIEYMDNKGRVILKKVETQEDGLTIFAETYYVYDDQDNLMVVLPPEAMTRVRKILFPQP